MIGKYHSNKTHHARSIGHVVIVAGISYLLDGQPQVAVLGSGYKMQLFRLQYQK